MGKYITRVTYTDELLPLIKSHDTYDQARRQHGENIGTHLMDDDAVPATFTIDSISTHGKGLSANTIDTWEFKGWASEPSEFNTGEEKPMYCPLCEEFQDPYEDVEQWSDAVIVYKFAGDGGGYATWEADHEEIGEHDGDHRVYCRHCGDTMPLDEWNEAYENR